jgi:hypothetical protein
MRWNVDKKPSKRELRLASRLKRGSKFFAFLWEIRAQLFTAEFQDELIAGFERRRADNVPPAMLAMVWLLQAYTQSSDRDAVDNAIFDSRWQLILGTLGRDEAPFGQGSLPRFRARLVRTDLDRRLVDRTVELARETGLFGSRNLRGVLDSSPLRGAGRVEDTWNLIGRAMKNLVGAMAKANDLTPEKLIQDLELKTMGGTSLKATLDIDWADEDARLKAFKALVEEANALTAWVEENSARCDAPVIEALKDLLMVLGQDTEPDPNGDGVRIKRGVAKDRVPSLGDKEMRHGRKSQAFKFNGYKRFFMVIPGVRLVAGALAQPANVPEADATGELLEDLERHGTVEGLDFDRGFLASPVIDSLRAQGIEIRCKPWRARNGSRFPKGKFTLDLQAGTATCPAQVTVDIRTSNQGVRKASWGRACTRCTLREKCTKAKRGRSVSVHRQEELHQELRVEQATPEGRAALRERIVVEHALARLQVLQGSRARYKGTRKNTMDLRRYAALSNLYEVRRHTGIAA